MRFVADENTPRPTIERLRADGHAIVSIAEVSAGISDVEVMRSSESHSYILVTCDRDFGELAILEGMPVTGLILLELERLTPDSQAERVSKLLA